MFPVGGIGAPRIGRTGGGDVAVGTFSEVLRLGGQPGVRLGRREGGLIADHRPYPIGGVLVFAGPAAAGDGGVVAERTFEATTVR